MYIKYTPLLVILLCVASALCLAPGRSGDIVVQSHNVVEDSAILLHGDLFKGTQLKKIEDVNVADLFAHVMGTQPFNVNTDRDGFPKGNLFDKASAALLVNLDSVSPASFTKYSTSKSYQQVDITTQSTSVNTFTMASSIATGTRPSAHAVATLAANMGDLLTQEFSKNSMVVSASASATLASMFAVHTQLTGRHSNGLKLQDGAFESIYSYDQDGSFGLTKQQVQNILKSSAFAESLGAQYNDGRYSLSMGTSSFTFGEDDIELFEELAFVYNFLDVLESNSWVSALVKDEAPDFYTISFSSLKAIKERYGEDSTAYAAALTMVDRAVQQTVAKIDKLYNNHAVSAIVCLNSHEIVSEELKRTVYEVARKSLRSDVDFDAHFPNLFISGNPMSACAELRAKVAGDLVTVHCFAQYSYSVSETSGITACNTSDCSSAQLNVPAFWILFWIGIFIAAWVLGGVYLLCAVGVDASKDSLLFRAAGRQHQN